MPATITCTARHCFRPSAPLHRESGTWRVGVVTNVPSRPAWKGVRDARGSTRHMPRLARTRRSQNAHRWREGSSLLKGRTTRWRMAANCENHSVPGGATHRVWMPRTRIYGQVAALGSRPLTLHAVAGGLAGFVGVV